METVVTILSVLGGLVALGGYIHADVRRVDARVGRVEARLEKLDARVYSLATGLKPLLDEASRADPRS